MQQPNLKNCQLITHQHFQSQKELKQLDQSVNQTNVYILITK